MQHPKAWRDLDNVIHTRVQIGFTYSRTACGQEVHWTEYEEGSVAADEAPTCLSCVVQQPKDG